MKHHPKLKRGAALALSALCFASLCAGIVSAAPTTSSSSNPRIGLDYEYNRTWDVLNKDKGIQIDTSKTAYILTNQTVTVQMSLGNADLPSESSGSNSTALNVNGKTNKDEVPAGSLQVTGTGQPGRYQITAKNLKTDNEQVQLSVEANINSVTTNSGYNGTVQARRLKQSGETKEPDPVGGDAKLLTPLAISQTSFIRIKCTEGEYGNFQPTFQIEDADGVFAKYKGGTATFRKESDTGSPFIRNRKIVVELSATGQTPLTVEFDQPITYDLIANRDNSGYLDSKFNLQRDPDNGNKPIAFTDDLNPNLVRVANNYVRKDSTYTFTFVKPISDILSLNIATPKYVVNQIAQNIQSNQQESYLKLSPGDRTDMLTGDIELTTYDFRYNADFDIAWTWEPKLSSTIPAEYSSQAAYEEAARRAIRPPSSNQGTAETPTTTVSLRPLVDDISGTLTATVTCRADKSATASYTFENVTVRGTGIPASVVATGQKVGEEKGATSESFNPVKDMPTQLKMDVFQGGIEGYVKKATGPCVYTLELKMGKKNARSAYAIARLSGDTDAVTLYTESDKNVLQQYTPGAQIENPYAGTAYTEEGSKTLQIEAEKAGTVTLTVDYYVYINGKPVVDSSHTMEIVVTDTSPSTDASLSTLTLRDAGRSEPAINFGFQPNKITYTNPVIDLPYVYKEYDLALVVNEAVASETPVKLAAFDSQGKEAQLFNQGNGVDARTATAEVKSGKSQRLTISDDDVGKVYTITLTVQAANPTVSSTYTLAVRRLPASEDDMLRSLGLYAQADTAGKTNFVTGFDPETRDYVITVPYSTKYLRVNAVPRFARAEVAFSPELESMTLFGAKEYLKVESLVDRDTFEGVELPYFNIYVTPEVNLPMDKGDENRASGHYRIFVNRLPPSENSRVTGLTVVNAADAAANPRALTYVPGFNANNVGPYRMMDSNAVPYSTSAVRFKITPQDTLVSAIRIYRVEKADAETPGGGNEENEGGGGTETGGENEGGGGTETGGENEGGGGTETGGENEGGGETRSRARTSRAAGEKRTLVATITNPTVFSEAVALIARNPDLAYNEFIIEVVSEAGDGLTGPELDALDHSNYYTEYRIQIERGEANTDADLLGVALNNQEGNPLKMFAFHRDETNYNITVPYAVRNVSFTATFSDQNATVQLKDHGDLLHSLDMNLDSLRHNSISKFYKLNDPGSPRRFDLIVTAEDGKTQKTYTFNIDREPPSNDALLKKLTVEGLTEDGLSPRFKPNDTAYSATVEEGKEGIRVTPTANNKNATIMVDGVEVKSGQISDLVELLAEQVKVDIVVTAEDGKTRKTYTLDLFNQNLVEKTNDADLGSLRVERGVMTPEFKAAVTEYEVAVKEDTYSVDIIPKPDDPLAEVKVMSGTRELGDYNGNYGLALQDGENEVTVRVTSPDKTQVKEYNITIYRNQEDALKTLTPLTADDVDFENSENPIVISVSEYPRIESSVFNALKEYPEKTIIFQGLDYSLTFQANNLNTVIPTREIYDFRLSFESLDADAIRAHMGQWDANAEIMGDLVMIYFDYHGDLPGPAMLNLKLGNKYGGQTLYWHYYNRERKVIEFYGTLRSNAQGSISVPLNHFSTYLLTRNRMITGAENYGNTLSQIRATIGAKLNPTTGADGMADGKPGDGT